jgi:ABC-type multidrug transport system fused ATPase/permease subunit
VLTKIVSGLIGLYGGYSVIKGTMTLGSLTALMIYLKQMMGLLKSLGQTYQTIVVNSVSRNRLAELMDQQEESFSDENNIIEKILQGISFENVSFSYDDKEKVIDSLSFKINAGEKIAIVGGSGTGKTTILALILGLYSIEKGKICIDEINIKDIEKQSFREKIGVVFQEPFLWNDTIKNNILYGSPSANEKEIMDVAKATCIDEFIEKTPKGYESNIGEMACKISEGQKQRIALARALIHKPEILILDEALSNVDSETEEKITSNLKETLKNSIVITVSHRLSTVKKMDKVYFLEGKNKIEINTHEELVKSNEKYRELFVGQL